MGKIRSAVWTSQAKITLLAHASVFLIYCVLRVGVLSRLFGPTSGLPEAMLPKERAHPHIRISARFDSRIFEPSCGTISLHAAGILALELLEG